MQNKHIQKDLFYIYIFIENKVSLPICFNY